jgi:dethiobiotin synthetase
MSDLGTTSGLFVAGTDTGVGKTIVTAGLVRLALANGRRARAIKPIETGCSVRAGVLFPEDGALLCAASGGALTLDETAPFRFSFPASPYRAAAMEGKRLKLANVVEHVRTVAAGYDLTLVEGAGGLMVPIEERLMMIDLMERLAYPVLLVARTALGTVNHTMLSVEAMKRRAIKLAGIVFSCTSTPPGPEEEFIPREVARLAGDVPFAVLPFLSSEIIGDPSAIARIMADLWPEQTLKKWLGT